VEHAVDRGTQDDQIANANREKEIEMIDGSGYYVVARMAVRSHGSRQVNPVHQPSPQESAEWVGVIGKNNLGHL
jgi:hypothetical protein